MKIKKIVFRICLVPLGLFFIVYSYLLCIPLMIIAIMRIVLDILEMYFMKFECWSHDNPTPGFLSKRSLKEVIVDSYREHFLENL